MSTVTPEGWQTVSLLDCVSGRPEYGANARAIDFDPELPRYLRITDIRDDGTLTDEGAKSLDWKSAKGNLLDIGDLVLARSGATVGKSYLHRAAIRLAYAGYLIRFRPDLRVIAPEFLYSVTRSARYWKWINSAIRAGAQPNINATEYGSFSFLLPPLPEQHRIADILSAWTGSLERLARTISATQTLFAVLRESLTSSVRAAGTRAKRWKFTALGKTTRQLSERNGNRLGRDEVMGVVKNVGLTPMKEHVIADAINRYLIVPPQAFAYNPMRINIGSIAMSELGREVIVSPDYVVFACDPQKLLPDYLNHLRRTRKWADFVTVAGNGSVRVRIYYADLAAFEFPLPKLEEQRLVIDTLDDGERELSLLRAEYSALERQRESLATQLLTGKLRVPEAGNALSGRL